MNINTHERIKNRNRTQLPSDRSFGFVFSTVFFIVGIWPLFWGNNLKTWSLFIAFGFLFITCFCPQVLNPINRIWTAFGELIHKIINPMIMGFLFYLVVTPTSILMRLAGKKPLELNFDVQQKSYWIDRKPMNRPSAESMKDQF
tara:strand:+ start:225 stop:656 length:432 start_codon:yes stop_codon:yes gene_type:complete